MSESSIYDLKALTAAAVHAREVWLEVTRKYRKGGSALIEYAKVAEVTISAFTEIGLAEDDITVPLQRVYTGRNPVISSSLADIPCATLGLHRVLEQLNITLRTSLTLDTPALSSLLEDCIAKNYDFGTAYGYLRTAWYSEDWSTIPDKMRECEEKDHEMRQTALCGSNILEPNMHPRRVWDLYSNRVVPMCSIGEPYPYLISHAWVDEKERTEVKTPINGYQWPVPIPKDTNLNLIRIEMLNKGLEYVWLDVLCLRQKGGLREDLPAEEWMLDVPIIGSVHRCVPVYIYLSGLGRPLSVEQDYFERNCCWFNRAWTLQEIGYEGQEICGVAPNGPLDAEPDEDGKYNTEILTRFHGKLQSLTQLQLEPFGMLAEMQHRMSTNQVDKIAAMAFLLTSSTISAYNESQCLEDAWTALMNSSSWYPEAGNAGAKWRPSWDQVMKTSLPKYFTALKYPLITVDRDAEANVDRCAAMCIEDGFVRGLNIAGTPGTDRHGELLVHDGSGVQHVIPITAIHQHPIPNDTYTLLACNSSHSISYQWVLGRSLSDGSFEKLSVFKMTRLVDTLRFRSRCHSLHKHVFTLI